MIEKLLILNLINVYIVTITLTLNCMLVNARSLNTRTVDNLLNILFVHEKIDVCCITETWLKPGDQAVLAKIKLRGYEIISSHRAKITKEEE